MPTKQLALVAEVEQDGLEMGVLQDGTPFLSARSLAGLCGVAPSTIIEWGPSWSRESSRARDRVLTALLDEAGFTGDGLFYRVTLKGRVTTAYPAVVCMAILDYYAYSRNRVVAQTNHRRLARAGLRAVIYAACGYNPVAAVPVEWQHYHDRLLLNSAPPGYFSVWIESSGLIMSAMRAGLQVDAQTVPDISIGQIWARHWAAQGYEEVFGIRKKAPHVYPPDAPQSQADIEAWVYPIEALGDFRLWLQNEYIPNKFPAYIRSKARKGAIPATRAELLIEAFDE